ncbi:MAG: DNA primase noncatalytic subunit PriX [Candidatus Micrarchaeota archaeon]|nr:DNA primase noncatalytic subunit PriX [Candidatus Micrarchaeota archaeon]MDE1833869.1 DNA primase noncatalytic subunit PriX [Candidatus Micrarchaeota archaeon]MDE1859356.1 DNA primase noncatalytic subunit PriX [Candidatus Micrarchaeota archaeon]
MEKISSDKLDFAYKYPFSEEAKEIVSQAEQGLDEKYIKTGKIRVEHDIAGDTDFSEVSMYDIKYTHVISYVYSRMLISAINNRYHIQRYADSEAKRSRKALEADTFPNIMKVLKELRVDVSYAEERFILPATKFLMLSPKTPEISLVHLELDKGYVYLPKEQLFTLTESASSKEIQKNLPIPPKELPKRIIAEAKTIKLPEVKVNFAKSEGSYRWIETLLATPIADVRHRTVNLVLAPYLTNIKGLSDDDAAKVILDYIEKCKTINPDTRINSSYVKYQCRYAKAKGMKPLSLEKAKELYKGILDLD